MVRVAGPAASDLQAMDRLQTGRRVSKVDPLLRDAKLDLSEEPLRELDHALVILGSDTLEYFADERLESFFAPVVSGRHFGAPGVTFPRSFEHRARCCTIELRIIAIW